MEEAWHFFILKIQKCFLDLASKRGEKIQEKVPDLAGGKVVSVWIPEARNKARRNMKRYVYQRKLLAGEKIDKMGNDKKALHFIGFAKTSKMNKMPFHHIKKNEKGKRNYWEKENLKVNLNWLLV